jgi:hypothetical protein
MLDWTPAFTSAILDVSVRATFLALLAAVLVRAFRVHSPSVRHTVWLGVLLAMLTMPGLRLLMPDLAVPMGSLAFVSSEDRSGTASLQWAIDVVAADEAGAAQPATRHAADGGSAATSAPWPVVLVAFYLAGVILFGGRLIRGGIGACLVARAGVPLHDAPGGGPYPIYESTQVITPVTTGLLWPRILLPTAWRTWTRDQLAAVVAHEAAHAARRDPLVAFLAQVNRALFWCHPLAWWLPRTLAAMAEDVCDVAGVDAAGTRERYAELLLSFARVVQQQGGRLAWHGSGVAGYGSLTDRIERVLDGRPLVSTSRRRSLAIAGSAVTALCLAAGVEGRAPTPSHAGTIPPSAPALTADDAFSAALAVDPCDG